MRASARVAEEGAYLVGGFGREDVLELAGLLFDFGLAVHGEAVGEQSLSQAVAANDVSGALTAARGKFAQSCCRRRSKLRSGFSASWQGFTNGL